MPPRGRRLYAFKLANHFTALALNTQNVYLNILDQTEYRNSLELEFFLRQVALADLMSHNSIRHSLCGMSVQLVPAGSQVFVK